MYLTYSPVIRRWNRRILTPLRRLLRQVFQTLNLTVKYWQGNQNSDPPRHTKSCLIHLPVKHNQNIPVYPNQLPWYKCELNLTNTDRKDNSLAPVMAANMQCTQEKHPQIIHRCDVYCFIVPTGPAGFWYLISGKATRGSVEQSMFSFAMLSAKK